MKSKITVVIFEHKKVDHQFGNNQKYLKGYGHYSIGRIPERSNGRDLSSRG